MRRKAAADTASLEEQLSALKRREQHWREDAMYVVGSCCALAVSSTSYTHSQTGKEQQQAPTSPKAVSSGQVPPPQLQRLAAVPPPTAMAMAMAMELHPNECFDGDCVVHSGRSLAWRPS